MMESDFSLTFHRPRQIRTKLTEYIKYNYINNAHYTLTISGLVEIILGPALNRNQISF